MKQSRKNSVVNKHNSQRVGCHDGVSMDDLLLGVDVIRGRARDYGSFPAETMRLIRMLGEIQTTRSSNVGVCSWLTNTGSS